MPRFSANLSMLYPDLPFLERFAAAAKDGFQAVEYLGPYDFDPSQIAATLKRHGLQQILFNLPSGDWGAGERGIGCLPERVNDFRAGVEEAIRYAKALQCPQVNCLAGIAPGGASRSALEDILAANLRYAADRLGDEGIRLLLEPINQRDIPGFFVSTSDHALRIMDAVGSANLWLQYDFYHMQIMQGDLIATFQALQARIAHVQIADNPGRHEPGTGEINHPFLFCELDRLGYDGFVGCEYKPLGKTSDGLGWMRSYL